MKDSKEWKARCIPGQLTIQCAVSTTRIPVGASRLRAVGKTGKMKGLS